MERLRFSSQETLAYKQLTFTGSTSMYNSILIQTEMDQLSNYPKKKRAFAIQKKIYYLKSTRYSNDYKIQKTSSINTIRERKQTNITLDRIAAYHKIEGIPESQGTTFSRNCIVKNSQKHKFITSYVQCQYLVNCTMHV